MGAGWYNGFGGKVEKEENIEDAARREVLEECGIKIKNQIEMGVVNFKFTNEPSKILEVHIFLSKDYWFGLTRILMRLVFMQNIQTKKENQ